MPVDHDVDIDSLRTSCLSFISTGTVESTETLIPDADEPPPYSSLDLSRSGTRQDFGSTLTLNAQHPTGNDGRRILLLIYIHGFMGNETSFQNFPADVHTLLAVLLEQTHSVQTKIYPRYRSKKAIQVATNDFSAWLKPHESTTTDVILLGHSLGGILAAEVALLPSDKSSSPQIFRHNLIGTISLDTPFLGMHPGVIKSGLGSIFSPSPPPMSKQTSREDHHQSPERANHDQQPMNVINGVANVLFAPKSQDPNYNPAFQNDVRLPVRSGWANAFHFVQKHSKDLRHATKQLVTSHLEFGGCLADMDGLKTRYVRIRLLEEEAEETRKSMFKEAKPPPRVRFVNYYTASTGRMKSAKIKSSESAVNTGETNDSILPKNDTSAPVVPPMTEQEEAKQERYPTSCRDDVTSFEELRNLEPIPLVDSDEESEHSDESPDLANSDTTSSHSTLTPMSTKKLDLPGLPNRPSPPVLPSSDKTTYIRLLLDYDRDLKNYRQALNTYRKTHCRLIKEERKSNQLYPRIQVERTKSGGSSCGIASNSHGNKAPGSDSNLTLPTSILDPEMVKQQQLQNDLESQEQEVEAYEHKLARLIEKAERKSGKSELRVERKIEKAERKIEKHLDKAEQKAEKDREKAERKVAKEAEKSEKRLAKEAGKTEKKANKFCPSVSTTSASVAANITHKVAAKPLTASSESLVTDKPSNKSNDKPKKDKKFCLLPPKDSQGNRDPCWVRVYMKGVDEVGAHCGLFFPWQPGEMEDGQDTEKGSSERYAGLVVGVAERVEEWVLEKATERVLEEVGED